MKKTFKLEDLDCANCAAKMETAVNQMPEVTSASISFMAQKLSFEAPDEQFDAALKKAEKVMRKIEPDVRVVL